MRLSRSAAFLLSISSCFLFVGSASATSVTGVANISGTVTVSGTAVDFHTLFVGSGSGDFTGLIGGTIGTLTGGPATGVVSDPGFVLFNQGAGLAAPITFDLTYIADGTGTVAGCFNNSLGSTCTLPGSPFTLFQESVAGSGGAGNLVLASLVLNGSSYTGTPSSGFSPTQSIFSTQFVLPGTITGILSELAGNGSITTTYSASFIATPPASVPEPGSIFLLAVGLMSAGLIARGMIQS